MKLKSALILLLFPFLCSFTRTFRVTNSCRLVNASRSVFLLDVDIETHDVFSAFKRRSLLQYLSRLNKQYFDDSVRMIVIHAPKSYYYFKDKNWDKYTYYKLEDVLNVDSLRQVNNDSTRKLRGYILHDRGDFLKYHFRINSENKVRRTIVLEIFDESVDTRNILKLFYATAKSQIINAGGSVQFASDQSISSFLRLKDIVHPNFDDILSIPYYDSLTAVVYRYQYNGFFLRNDSFHFCEPSSNQMLDTGKVLFSFKNVRRVFSGGGGMLVSENPQRFYYYKESNREVYGPFEFPHYYGLSMDESTSYFIIDDEVETKQRIKVRQIQMRYFVFYANVLSGHITLDTVQTDKSYFDIEQYKTRLEVVEEEQVNTAHSPQWHYDAAKDNKKNALLALITMLFIAGVYRYNKKRK